MEDQAKFKKKCRICGSSTISMPSDKFVQPCLCTGENRWIHIDCLKDHIKPGPTGFIKEICDNCKKPYNVEIEGKKIFESKHFMKRNKSMSIAFFFLIICIVLNTIGIIVMGILTIIEFKKTATSSEQKKFNGLLGGVLIFLAIFEVVALWLCASIFLRVFYTFQIVNLKMKEQSDVEADGVKNSQTPKSSGRKHRSSSRISTKSKISKHSKINNLVIDTDNDNPKTQMQAKNNENKNFNNNSRPNHDDTATDLDSSSNPLKGSNTKGPQLTGSQNHSNLNKPQNFKRTTMVSIKGAPIEKKSVQPASDAKKNPVDIFQQLIKFQKK